MRLIGLAIGFLSSGCKRISAGLYRITRVLDALVPALISPADLSGLIRNHYEDSYREAPRLESAAAYGTGLAEWEHDVLARHHITSGTMMVLGAGAGRESFELARRGLRVISLDINRNALRLAERLARSASIPVVFIQASFYAIPTRPASLDYVLLSGIMYSAIPGRQARQAWLIRLRRQLRPGGLAILNYYTGHSRETESSRRIQTLTAWLATLPGANSIYQPGDLLLHDHFLHAFLSEDELRSELTETGARILQLDWAKQFTVLTWPDETAAPGTAQPGRTP